MIGFPDQAEEEEKVGLPDSLEEVVHIGHLSVLEASPSNGQRASFAVRSLLHQQTFREHPSDHP